MAFNGAGVFNRLYSWVTDRMNGVKIQAARVDAEMDGLAAGLSQTILRDGQSTITAAIPFNGQRITGLGDPAADYDALNRHAGDLRYAQLGAANTFAAATTFSAAATFGATATFSVAPSFPAGGSFGADVTLSYATPGIRLINGGTADWRARLASARWQFCDGAQTVEYLSFGTDGSISTRQLGDLKSYIDAADAYAAAQRGDRVAKAGDTMSGDLIVSKAYPRVQLYWGGVYAWDLMGGNDARLWFRNGTDGAIKASIGNAGDIWTAQLGDLNGRIEARAEAFAASYANDRLATATARINNKSARMVFAGDVGNSDTQGGDMWERGPGQVITGRITLNVNGAGTWLPVAFRFRQLQMSNSNGEWYNCGNE